MALAISIFQKVLVKINKNEWVKESVIGLNDAPSDFFQIHCAAIVESKNEDFPHFREEYGTSSNKGIWSAI